MTKGYYIQENKQTNRKTEKSEGEKKLGQRQTEDFKNRQ